MGYIDLLYNLCYNEITVATIVKEIPHGSCSFHQEVTQATRVSKSTSDARCNCRQWLVVGPLATPERHLHPHPSLRLPSSAGRRTSLASYLGSVRFALARSQVKKVDQPRHIVAARPAKLTSTNSAPQSLVGHFSFFGYTTILRLLRLQHHTLQLPRHSSKSRVPYRLLPWQPFGRCFLPSFQPTSLSGQLPRAG